MEERNRKVYKCNYETYYFAAYNPDTDCTFACSVKALNELQAKKKISEKGFIPHYAIRNTDYIKRHFDGCDINLDLIDKVN